MAEKKTEPQGAASSWFPPLQAPAGEENNLSKNNSEFLLKTTPFKCRNER